MRMLPVLQFVILACHWSHLVAQTHLSAKRMTRLKYINILVGLRGLFVVFLLGVQKHHWAKFLSHRILSSVASKFDKELIVLVGIHEVEPQLNLFPFLLPVTQDGSESELDV